VILNLVSGKLTSRTNVAGSLFYRHPEYLKTWWWREFGRVSYLGGREYYEPQLLSVDFKYPDTTLNADGSAPSSPQVLNQNYNSLLYRHEREQTWEFENRRKRSTYYNFPRTIVNSLVSHATNRPATRDGDDGLTRFWGGVDYKRRQTMDQFMTLGLQQAQVQDMMWACVDADATGTDADPYIYWVSPLDILDWDVDEDGEIAWLKQFYYTETNRSHEEKVQERYGFRIWHRDHVDTWECDPNGGKKTQLPTKTYRNGPVPFVPLYSLRTDEKPFPQGTALAIDLCKCANTIYNYSSLLSEILYKQTFSWLAVPDKNVDTLQLGVNTAFGYDAQGTSAVPSYISPDPEQARVLMESIVAAVEQARQAVGVGRGRAESSMTPASGETATLESADKRSLLGDISAEAQDFEIRLAEMVLSFRAAGSVPSEKPTIKYAQDFDIDSLKSEINEALSIQKLGLSPEIWMEIQKNIARRKLAGMPPKELEALVETIKPPEEPEPGEEPAMPGAKPPFGK
jgi:hypothetical protein